MARNTISEKHSYDIDNTMQATEWLIFNAISQNVEVFLHLWLTFLTVLGIGFFLWSGNIDSSKSFSSSIFSWISNIEYLSLSLEGCVWITCHYVGKKKCFPIWTKIWRKKFDVKERTGELVAAAKISI